MRIGRYLAKGYLANRNLNRNPININLTLLIHFFLKIPNRSIVFFLKKRLTPDLCFIHSGQFNYNDSGFGEILENLTQTTYTEIVAEKSRQITICSALLNKKKGHP